MVPSGPDTPPGVIFVLKNRNNSVNIDNRNRIHPFYMVYMGLDGTVQCDYLNPKKLLDTQRLLCRGQDKPIPQAYRVFNRRTKDGRSMGTVSRLLSDAIDSIVDAKAQSDIESLFSPGGTTALLSEVTGLEGFELICFLAIV